MWCSASTPAELHAIHAMVADGEHVRRYTDANRPQCGQSFAEVRVLCLQALDFVSAGAQWGTRLLLRVDACERAAPAQQRRSQTATGTMLTR